MISAKNYCFAMAIACLAISCNKDVTNTPTSSNEPTYSTLTTAKETLLPIQTPITAFVDSNIAGYQQALPAGYALNPTTRYPLIVFLHGKGEEGNGSTDLYRVNKHSVPYLIANKKFPASFSVGGKDYSFIVISPQFKKQPSPQQAYDMIRYAIKKYRIDTTRIYVTGLSMGGGTNWHVGGRYYPKIAAVVPMAGASGLNDLECKNMATSGEAVWAFHNSKDPSVPFSTTQNWIIHINKYHPKITPILTVGTVAAHDCWTKASDPNYKQVINGKSMNIYEWMLCYHR